MTVVANTVLGGAAQLGGAPAAGRPTALAGAEFGAELALGLSAGVGSEAGPETNAGGCFSAAFQRASGYAESAETVAFAVSKGENGTRLSTTTKSEAQVVGEESFIGTWQPMLHAWGVAAHASGEASEEAADESSETNAANKTSGGPSAGCTRTARVAAGGGATRSALSGSRAVLPAKKSTGSAELKQCAYGLSAIKPAGGTGSSSVRSKIEKRNNRWQSAEMPRQVDQAANGAGGSPIDGYAAQGAASLQANIPPANLTNSLTQGDSKWVDEHVSVSLAAAKPPTPTPVFALSGVAGAASVTSATAATNSTVGARPVGQMPIHAAKTSPRSRTMNSGGASGAIDEDGEQKDPAVLPQELSKPTGNNAAAGPSKSIGTHPLDSSFRFEEGKTPAEGIAAYRAPDVSSGTSAKKATPMAEAGGRSANSPENVQSPLNEPAHQAPLMSATSAAAQQTAAHSIVAQSAGIEMAAMVRDPVGAHGSANAPATIGGSTESPVPGPQQTFAALDAGTTVGAPSWIHAGGRQAEAGFEDPALGWVGVRADLSGGSVHAALVPGSTEAAQALSAHLAGLNTYLSEQHTPVATLTMAAPGSSGIEAGPEHSWDQGMGQGMQQGRDQHGEQNPAEGFELGSQPSFASNVSSLATSGAASAIRIDATAYAREGRGTHISVMA